MPVRNHSLFGSYSRNEMFSALEFVELGHTQIEEAQSAPGAAPLTTKCAGLCPLAHRHFDYCVYIVELTD